MTQKVITALIMMFLLTNCVPIQAADKPAAGQTKIDTLDLLCQAHCGLEQRCGQNRYGEQDCLCACRHRFRNVFSHYQPEFAVAASQCLERLECKRSDDICFARGGQAVLKKIPNRILLEKRCMEIRKDCRFWGDLCRALIGLKEEYFKKATACLGGECKAIEDCLLDAVGRKDRSKDPGCRKAKPAK